MWIVLPIHPHVAGAGVSISTGHPLRKDCESRSTSGISCSIHYCNCLLKDDKHGVSPYEEGFLPTSLLSE